MLPRAHIGYLVGHDSRNVYRIWIPSKKRVIRTRDVTFDHKSFWAPDDVDMGHLLRENSDVFLDALVVPQSDAQEILEEENVFEILEVDGFDTPASAVKILSKSSDEDMDSLESEKIKISSITSEDDKNPAIPKSGIGSHILHGIDSNNILTSKHLRKLAQLAGYHYAFSSALLSSKIKVRRNTLPAAPKTSRQIKSHIHSIQFKQACDMKFNTLIDKGMFKCVEEKYPAANVGVKLQA